MMPLLMLVDARVLLCCCYRYIQLEVGVGLLFLLLPAAVAPCSCFSQLRLMFGPCS